MVFLYVYLDVLCSCLLPNYIVYLSLILLPLHNSPPMCPCVCAHINICTYLDLDSTWKKACDIWLDLCFSHYSLVSYHSLPFRLLLLPLTPPLLLCHIYIYICNIYVYGSFHIREYMVTFCIYLISYSTMIYNSICFSANDIIYFLSIWIKLCHI